MGMGLVKLQLHSRQVKIIHVVTYVPKLKTNLLSIWEFDNKGYNIFA